VRDAQLLEYLMTCRLPFLLLLAACQTGAVSDWDHAPGLTQSAPPIAMTLVYDDCVVQGDSMTVRVTGAAPNATVGLLGGRTSGPQYCPAVLAGTCTDLGGTPTLLGVATADGSGEAVFTLTTPQLGQDLVASLQAGSRAGGDVYLSDLGDVRLDAPGYAGDAAYTWGPVVSDPTTGTRYQLVTSIGDIDSGDAKALATSAIEACEAGALVSITSQAEQDFLFNDVLGNDWAWIGLERDRTLRGQSAFAWSNGEPGGFTAWSPGEPNNAAGFEDVVVMYPDSGLWNDYYDAGGFAVRSFLVEYGSAPTVDPVTGNAYLRVDAALPWAEAMLAAQSARFEGRRGHLVTVTSPGEQSFVAEVNDEVRTWIGGYQDLASPFYAEPFDGWRWVTEEFWGYTNWGGGEPNETLNLGEDSAQLVSGSRWNDSRSVEAFSYLVEFDAAPLATAPTTAVAWLSFEGDVDDVTGDHDARVSGGAVDFAFPPPAGSAGPTYLALDAGDGLTLDDPAAFDFDAGAAFTLAMWVRADAAPSGEFRAVFTKTPPAGQQDPTTHTPSLLVSNGFWAYDLYFQGEVRSTSPVVPGEWTHLAVRAAGDGTVTLFVDGVAEGTATLAGANENGAGWQVRLGDNGGVFPSNAFEGAIDEFAYFDAPLTDAEIGGLASGLAGRL
jgi:hypothetical protein